MFRVSDPALAGRCLTAAEHIFDLADTAPRQLLTVIPFSFYPESEWRDDLELGATELYLAVAAGGLPAGLPHTDPGFYLQAAAHWANAYITGPERRRRHAEPVRRVGPRPITTCIRRSTRTRTRARSRSRRRRCWPT